MEGMDRRNFLKILGVGGAAAASEQKAEAQKTPEKGATFNPSSEFQKILQKYSSVDGGKVDIEVLKEDAEKHRGYAKEDPGTARIENNVAEFLELKYKIIKSADREVKFWEKYMAKPEDKEIMDEFSEINDNWLDLPKFKRMSDRAKLYLNIDKEDIEWKIPSRQIGTFYEDMKDFLTKMREYYQTKGAKISFRSIDRPFE